MKRNIVLSAIALLTILLAAAVPAHAQATRTWVSGVGDDANPCSRTAPCKTFAGAISKTAPGGEINVLDPGGFGAVTITKSITISSECTEAGVLVSGTHAIIISAAPTDVVVIRGLDIEGLGTGLTAIRVLSAGAVHVENCTIHHFTANGIDFLPSSATPGSTSQLFVSNSILRENTGAGGAIHVKPGTNVTVTGMIENTQIRDNSVGIRVEDFSTIAAKNTTVANNAGSGFIAAPATSGNPATLNLESCVATGNGTGIKADLNASATVRISHCLIAGNGTGLSAPAGGKIISSTGTNANFDSGAPTGPNVTPQ
jgi:hypothetical protein